MARLYFDEDVAVDRAQPLRAFGHHVTDAHAERQEEHPDPYQLLYASERGLTLPAYNGRDHFLRHHAWGIWAHHWQVGEQHAGVLLVPHVRPDQISQLARDIDDILTRADTVLAHALYQLTKLGGEWLRNPRRLHR